MIDDDWRFDLEQWPGPAREITAADVIQSFRKLGRHMSLDLGKTFIHTEMFRAVKSIHDEFYAPVPDIKVPKVPVLQRNHGPRSNQTFDHRGRRRY